MQKGRLAKRIMALLMGTCLAVTVQTMNVQAAQDAYTVTYRPGNVGYFGLSQTEYSEKQDMAKEVAELLYAGNEDVQEINITQNGAIKLTVKKGATIPAAPGAAYVRTNAGYFVKNVSEWGAEATAVVEKNVDYVVDYGKLVNGVEYSVQYVDEQSNVSLAPVGVAYGNVGDKVEVVAPGSIVVSGGANYTLVGNAVAEMVLSADSSKNVITFTYTYQAQIGNAETIYEYVAGDVIERVEVVYVPGQQTPGAVLAPGQGGTTPEQGGTTTPVQGDENENGQVNIPDENVPLGGGDETGEQQENTNNDGQDVNQQENTNEGNTNQENNNPDDVIEIEDEDVALSAGEKSGKSIYWGLAASLVTLTAVGAVWFKSTRKKAEDQTEE